MSSRNSVIATITTFIMRSQSWQGFKSEEYDRSKTHVTPNLSFIVYTLSYDLYIDIVTGNQPC